jgi:pyruvate/2-oxoacid:ferredoxin oxidoreductase beta subunit
LNVNEFFDARYKKFHKRVGGKSCAACGGVLNGRLIIETIIESGKKVIISGLTGSGNLGTPCVDVRMTRDVPRFGMNFSSGPDVASGIVLALEALDKSDIIVWGVGGDGTIGDIAFAKTSSAAERNTNMIQLCVDNEAYMNTGIQKSGSTPIGAWTTTTPWGKTTPKKYLPIIMVDHHIPYVATLSPAYPEDLKKKVNKALDLQGYRYLHTLMPCPTGWRFPNEKVLEIARLGVQTWHWPLYEVENGVLKLTQKPKPKPVKDYIKAQDRFRNLTEDDIRMIQEEKDRFRERLLENDGKNIWWA